MPATGIVAAAMDAVVQALTDAGLSPITDPRAVRPPCLLVEPPDVQQITGAGIVECDVPIYALAVPPGNANVTTWLVEMADAVIQAVNVTSASLITYTTANQELPAYQFSSRITIRR